LISDSKEEVKQVLILELLDFVDDVVDELGSHQIKLCASDIKKRNWSSKQLRYLRKRMT
jgi:hypothetical protein